MQNRSSTDLLPIELLYAAFLPARDHTPSPTAKLAAFLDRDSNRLSLDAEYAAHVRPFLQGPRNQIMSKLTSSFACFRSFCAAGATLAAMTMALSVSLPFVSPVQAAPAAQEGELTVTTTVLGGLDKAPVRDAAGGPTIVVLDQNRAQATVPVGTVLRFCVKDSDSKQVAELEELAGFNFRPAGRDNATLPAEVLAARKKSCPTGTLYVNDGQANTAGSFTRVFRHIDSSVVPEKFTYWMVDIDAKP